MTDLEGVQPPSDLGAEGAILGAILMGGDLATAALDATLDAGVGPDAFYSGAHRDIFGAIIALRESGQPVDSVQVASWLRDRKRLDRVGGAQRLIELVSGELTTTNAGAYARRVADAARLRSLIDTLTRLRAQAYNRPEDVASFLAGAEAEVRDVTTRGESKSGETLASAVGRVLTDVTHGMTSPGRIIGVPTGFEGLDRRMSGLRDKTVTIIAARPGMGKSALALNMALHIARETGRYVPFFSLEMSNDEQAMRAIATETPATMNELISSTVSAYSMSSLIGYAGTVRGLPVILFDEATITVQQIGAKVRRLSNEAARVGKTVGAVFIDYLQLIKSPRKTQSREAEVADVSRSIKLLAKELGIPFVVMAQLNREGEKGEKPQRPKLSNLRESGSIEQDADVVVFIHRESYYDANASKDDVAELIIAKGRNIQKGIVRVKFDGRHTRFGKEELEEVPQ